MTRIALPMRSKGCSRRGNCVKGLPARQGAHWNLLSRWTQVQNNSWLSSEEQSRESSLKSISMLQWPRKGRPHLLGAHENPVSMFRSWRGPVRCERRVDPCPVNGSGVHRTRARSDGDRHQGEFAGVVPYSDPCNCFAGAAGIVEPEIA